ncbi:MAG: hypothetical protein KTR16_03890 [Acidiferrobacterales bacterium]|nr:hypothetical protein [Acidiferrobacterales bacterium]
MHKMFVVGFLLPAFLFSFLNLHAQETTSKPCATEEHRAFDFWLGVWSVTASGKYAGKNKISLEQNGCVLRESWASASPGYTGTSLNFFNANKKQWQQLWVDNQGASLELTGGLINGAMVLSSKAVESNDGKMQVNRITWSKNKDGSVRQTWDLLEDEKVVNVLFDGQYQRIEEN